MKEKYASRVKELWPLRNGDLIVKLEGDGGVDDQDLAESFNQMSCHLSSFILGLSKRLMNNVILEKDSFYTNMIYFGDKDKVYAHKKYWSTFLKKVLSVNPSELVKTSMDMQAYSTLGSWPQN